MEIGILLLVVLFIVGFINTLFYVPPNKFLAYMLSFFPYNTSSSCSNMSTKSSTSPIFSPPEEEEENKKKKKKNKSTHELKKVFATFDKNGDGFITKQELKDSLKSIGLFCNDKEVGTMVEMLDANGDGLIDIDEFYDMYESMVKPSGGGEGDGVEKEEEEGELREAFDVFDGDKDGLISVEELDSVLSSLGLKQGIRLEDCKEMINKVDIDGDGMVNFDEFKQMMRGGGNLISVS